MKMLLALLNATVLAVSLTPLPSTAQTPPPGAMETPPPNGPVAQRALIDITVNTVDQGIHAVLIQNGDIQISRDDLDSLGLARVAALFGPAGGAYVSLSALSAGLTYTFDQSKLALSIIVQPRYLSASSVSLAGNPNTSLSHISSAFLNYGVLMTQNQPGSLSTQLGSTLGPGVFSATFNNIDQAYRMTNVFWRYDDPKALTSSIVGDSYNDLGDLSGSSVIRGLTYQSNFGLNPYFSRLASHSLSGYVSTPSTAYIYVNGQLIGQLQLQPGAFNITNLPQLSGITNAQVVIRDAFGNTQVLSQTYYEGVQLLPTGVDNFIYSAGDPQNGQGQSIGPNAGIAEFSRGISNNLTLGGRAEFSQGLANGGPVLALATRLGELDFIALGSSGQGYGGSAGEVTYNYLSHNWDLNLLYQTQTPNYANIILAPTEDRLTENFVASLGVQAFKNQFVNFQWTESQDLQLGHLSGYGAETSVNLTAYLSLLLDFEHQQGYEGIQNDFYTSLLFPIGQNTFVSVTQDGSTTGGNTSYEVDRPSRPDQPLGFTFSDTAGSEQNQVFDQLTYEAPFGQYYAQHNAFNGVSTNQVDVAGAIDFADQNVLLSRPIQNGYGIVDTGIPNVPVYVNGIWVGTTNGAGLLANPDVIPYAQNEITIDTSRLPLNLNFDSTEKTLTSPYLIAGITRFNAERTRAFLGSVVVVAAGKSVNPQFGVLTLSLASGQSAASELGENGEFYFANIEAGTYPAHIDYTGGTCDFTVTIPQSTDFYVRLGQLTCTTSKASSAPSSSP